MAYHYLKKNYKQYFEDDYLFKNHIIVFDDDNDDNEDDDYNNINNNNNNDNNEIDINLSEYIGENNSSSIEIESNNNSIIPNDNNISLKHINVIEKENDKLLSIIIIHLIILIRILFSK
jgi:hypothetical protein